MEVNIQFKNGYILNPKLYEQIKKELLVVIKNELPEEVQTLEIISYIFKNVVEDLDTIQVKL